MGSLEESKAGNRLKRILIRSIIWARQGKAKQSLLCSHNGCEMKLRKIASEETHLWFFSALVFTVFSVPPSETVVVNIGAMGGEKVSPTCHTWYSLYLRAKVITLKAMKEKCDNLKLYFWNKWRAKHKASAQVLEIRKVVVSLVSRSMYNRRHDFCRWISWMRLRLEQKKK